MSLPNPQSMEEALELLEKAAASGMEKRAVNIGGYDIHPALLGAGAGAGMGVLQQMMQPEEERNLTRGIVMGGGIGAGLGGLYGMLNPANAPQTPNKLPDRAAPDEELPDHLKTPFKGEPGTERINPITGKFEQRNLRTQLLPPIEDNSRWYHYLSPLHNGEHLGRDVGNWLYQDVRNARPLGPEHSIFTTPENMRGTWNFGNK